jgi:hypothetical protein
MITVVAVTAGGGGGGGGAAAAQAERSAGNAIMEAVAEWRRRLQTSHGARARSFRSSGILASPVM